MKVHLYGWWVEVLLDFLPIIVVPCWVSYKLPVRASPQESGVAARATLMELPVVTIGKTNC